MVHNQAPHPTGLSPDTTLGAGSTLLHPGWNCENATVRFMAPRPGRYRVSGEFFAADTNASQGTKTRAYLTSHTALFPKSGPAMCVGCRRASSARPVSRRNA